MAIAYFDSSAFVKLLIDEDGSEVAASLWDACDAAVSSRIAYPEVRAALAAAVRAQRLKPVDERHAVDNWDDIWASTRGVELTAEVTADAGRLASEHALRGADAVHLASLLAVGVSTTVFAVWDKRLAAAGSAVGARLVPRPPVAV